MISSLATVVNQPHAAPMEAAHTAMPQGLIGRHSLDIKHLAEPRPDEAPLLTMTQAALRAPDHTGLVPFRFKVVRGVQRDALAELFAQAARDAGKEEAGAALDAERVRR
jgi:nitroreductase